MQTKKKPQATNIHTKRLIEIRTDTKTEAHGNTEI